MAEHEISIKIDPEFKATFKAGWVEQVIEQILDIVNIDGIVELSVVFTSDNILQDLNRKYRNIDHNFTPAATPQKQIKIKPPISPADANLYAATSLFSPRLGFHSFLSISLREDFIDHRRRAAKAMIPPDT